MGGREGGSEGFPGFSPGRFFESAGGGIFPSGGVQPPQITFTVSPGEVNAGGIVTLTWSVANGPTSVTLDNGIGAVAASGTQNVTVNANTTYTLTATNMAGTRQATAGVVVASKPVIHAFTANPSSIPQGANTTLTWSVDGADSVQINGQVVTGSTLVVGPSQTTTYALVATNSAGSESATLTITVVIPESFQWVKTMVYGFGQLLSEESATGTLYVQGDQVGSPNILTDASGTVVGMTKNLPFGERFGSWGQQSGKRFTNHEDQPGSAIYMQARMYLPAYGKFAQPDPAHDQWTNDPETWNLYNYVTNNPVTHTDPDGRAPNAPNIVTPNADQGDWNDAFEAMFGENAFVVVLNGGGNSASVIRGGGPSLGGDYNVSPCDPPAANLREPNIHAGLVPL